MDSAATLPSMGRIKERTEFGQRVWAARKHAGLSQEELGRRVGLTQSGIVHLETAGDSSNKTAQIARECGVRVMWLAKGEEPMLGPEDGTQAAELIASEAVASYAASPNSANDYRTIAHTMADALQQAGIEVNLEQFLTMVDAAFARQHPG